MLDKVLHNKSIIVLFCKIFFICIILVIMIAGIIYTNHCYCINKSHNKQYVGDMLVDIMYKDRDTKTTIIPLLDNVINRGVYNNQIEIAEIQRVFCLIESNNEAIAIKCLEDIIINPQYHDLTTSFARLIWLNLILDKKSISEEVKTKAYAYMQYFQDPQQAFFIHATLLKAIFYQKDQQYTESNKYANIILNLKIDSTKIVQDQARAILYSNLYR